MQMKIYQINVVCGNGSTGKIAVDLSKAIELTGGQCRIAYGRGTAPANVDTFKISGKMDLYKHAIMSRITDRHGLYSKKATKRLINDIKEQEDNLKAVHYASTATSARHVAKSDRKIAAICSERCAEIYKMNILDRNISDEQANFTRFICISKKLEIYPGSDKTSIMMILPHKPGALYKILSRFSSISLRLYFNLSKNEPIMYNL